MAVTPQITLTANLESILAGAGTGGFLRITLCGSGLVMPAIPGTCMLADATIPQIIGPQISPTPLSILLYGNDVIVPGPDVTFYEIAVLDKNQNVIQTGMYRFDGTETVDLSQAVQILPPYPFADLFPTLAVRVCAGATPGRNYVAPGVAIAVFLNQGILTPTDDYTAIGKAITLTFDTEASDEILALCIVPS